MKTLSALRRIELILTGDCQLMGTSGSVQPREATNCLVFATYIQKHVMAI